MARKSRGTDRAEVLRSFELHGALVKAGTFIQTDELGELLQALIRRGAIRLEGRTEPEADEAAAWRMPPEWANELVEEQVNG